MKIEKHTVVTLNYTLKNGGGDILDTSEGREPLVYLQGVGALIPGLEKQLEGKEKGASLQATVAPEEAYGVRSDEYFETSTQRDFSGK